MTDANNLLFIQLALGLLLSGSDTRAADDSVPAPFGVRIGQETRAAVLSKLSSRAAVKPHGTNRYSQGPMLLATGKGLGIDYLQQALFIFDPKGILVAVVMTLDQGVFAKNFDSVHAHLARKYTLVREDIPSVGDRYARFRQGEVTIDMDAPHLSFSMTVSYMTIPFERTVEQQRRNEAEDRQRQEGRRF